MTSEQFEATALRAYLLSALPSRSRDEIENRLMAGDSVLEDRLERAEDELIDEYVSEELSKEEREVFEVAFLTAPRRLEKLAFARRFDATLRTYAESTQTEPDPQPGKSWPARAADWLGGLVLGPTSGGGLARQPALRVALVAAQATILLVGAWLVRTNRLQKEEIATLRAAVEATTTRSAVAVAWLTPALLRSEGEMTRLRLSTTSALVRLYLDVGARDHEHYRVTVLDTAGDELWTRTRLGATETDGKIAVMVLLPAELLGRGDYELTLEGVTDDGDLSFVDAYYVRVLSSVDPLPSPP